MSSEYDEGYRAGLQKSRDVAGPYVNKLQEANTELEIRIDRTLKVLECLYEFYWEDNPSLSEALKTCTELLDGTFDKNPEEEKHVYS